MRPCLRIAAVLLFAWIAVLRECSGFTTSSHTASYNTRWISPLMSTAALHQDIPMRVQPKTPIPQSKRSRAPRGASVKQKQQTELDLMDLLSKPVTKEKTLVSAPPRRRGRPESVPAALGFEAALKQQEKLTGKKIRRETIMSKRGNFKHEAIPFHRYDKTKLLSREEEYSSGIKVQFMVQCEAVHEGLAKGLGRPPTFEEWGQACGFDTPDPSFHETEYERLLRPAGWQSMFEEVGSHRFVGNGLAKNAGVGRGNGRRREPAPMKMGNYFDDTQQRFSEGKVVVLNKGTTTDFVDLLMDCKAAKQRMIQCNMRLVVSIARKFCKAGVNLQDLVQEGSLGLNRAAEKFEPRKGFKFSTYASWWIQQSVFRAIAYHSRTIRLPVHIHILLNRVRKIRISMEQDLGRPATDEELAVELDMTTDKFKKFMDLTRRSISLELPKYKGNPKDLGASEDMLGDTIDASAVLFDESSPEQRVDRGLFRDDLREMLKVLSPDERKVICIRYGLHDGLTRTVSSVAAYLDQPKNWVRCQENRALRKLRRPWYEGRLRQHENSILS